MAMTTLIMSIPLRNKDTIIVPMDEDRFPKIFLLRMDNDKLKDIVSITLMTITLIIMGGDKNQEYFWKRN